jgi:hypothetical protein
MRSHFRHKIGLLVVEMFLPGICKPTIKFIVEMFPPGIHKPTIQLVKILFTSIFKPLGEMSLSR